MSGLGEFLGSLLSAAFTTSDTPGPGRPRWLSCLILFVVFGVGGGALAAYAFLEQLEASR